MSREADQLLIDADEEESVKEEGIYDGKSDTKEKEIARVRERQGRQLTVPIINTPRDRSGSSKRRAPDDSLLP